jgi:hypothetical protein
MMLPEFTTGFMTKEEALKVFCEFREELIIANAVNLR